MEIKAGEKFKPPEKFESLPFYTTGDTFVISQVWAGSIDTRHIDNPCIQIRINRKDYALLESVKKENSQNGKE